MKRKILKTIQVLALLMASSVTLQGQTVFVVAEGTSSSNSVPFRPFNAPYAQWTQTIYPASVLGSLVGQTLTAFTYHTSVSTFTPDPGEWTIKLGITSWANLSQGKDQTQCTTVFSGTPTFDASTGNMTFSFDTPYEYNGGNLLVYFDHQAGTTTAQASWTFQSAVENDASRYAVNSSFTSAYNTEGAVAAYRPTVWVTVDGDGGCEAVAVDGATPFRETFLDAWTDGKPTVCWADNSHVSGYGTARWSKSYQGHDDLYGAKLQCSYYPGGAPIKANLVTPKLNIPVGGGYTVGMWVKRSGGSTVYGDAGVRVFVNDTPDTVGATLVFFAPQHIGAVPAVGEAGWYYFEGVIPTAGEQYVIVQGVDQGIADVCIDELEVKAIPSCDHPTGLSWDGTQVSWVAGNATQWQVRDGGTYAVVSTPAYIDTTWQAATSHSVYVRSICGPGDTLEWRGPVSFSMPCEVMVLDGSNAYTEDFDALTTSGAIPGCWSREHVSGPGSDLWGSYSAQSAHSGNRVMRLPDMRATTITHMVSPQLSIPTAGSYEAGLWIKRGTGTKALEGVKAWVNSTPDTVGGTLLFHAPRCIGTAPVESAEGWYEFKAPIPMAGNVYIVLQGISEWGQETWIDDFTVAPAAATPAPVVTSFDSVRYWVGAGQNAATFTLHFNNAATPTSLVWGYRWDDPNGDYTVSDMMQGILDADSRVEFTGMDMGFLNSYGYTDANYTLTAPTGYNYAGLMVNGAVASAGMTSMPIADGDAVAWLDADIGFFYGGPISLGVTDTVYVEAPDTVPVVPPVPDPVDATIAFEDILYWVGSGADSAVFIVNYAQPDTAFAWGYLFNGSTTAQAMVDAIASADPRFWYEGSPSTSGDIHFLLETGDTLGLSPVDAAMGYNFWWTNLNGVSVASGIGATLQGGDVFKFGDLNSATPWDFQYGYYMENAWLKVPTPVAPPANDTIEQPEDATISAADIVYWVGSGANEAIMAVNWADTALAWGFRFDGAQITANTMMDSIAAADPRFGYVTGAWGVDDIRYIDTASGMTDTLGITPGNYWWSLINGGGAMGMGTVVRDGDFFKWGDLSVATVVDSVMGDWGMEYSYVWTRALTPVTVPTVSADTVVPQPEHGPFCGPVGTEGCTAIAGDSSVFVAWATGCTVERGPRNISDENSPLVTYGEPEDAVGPVDTNNMAVVSLGDGGWATLTFDRPIVNGAGPDFAVFENGFNDYFLELAFVEVSSDGQRFVRFPATSLTPTETQVVSRVDPTFINNLAGKYRSYYGTPFDLEELRDSAGINIDSITHVRVVDVVGSMDPLYASYDAFGHMVNDPWPTSSYSGGFDLAGVGVIHQADPSPQGVAEAEEVQTAVWPNPVGEVLNVSVLRPVVAVLYDYAGRAVGRYTLAAGRNEVDVRGLASGVYMLRTEESVSKIIKR